MEQLFVRDTYCGFCGSRFPEQKLWPRKCFFCYNDTYRNPIPVVAGLIPARLSSSSFDTGLLIGLRGIAPGKDKWALIGGFIEAGEAYKEAIAREVKEEIGLITDSGDWALFEAKTTSEHILLFCVCTSKIITLDTFSFTSNDEVKDLAISFGETELAFPTHQQAVSEYIHYLDPHCP